MVHARVNVLLVVMDIVDFVCKIKSVQLLMGVGFVQEMVFVINVCLTMMVNLFVPMIVLCLQL